MGKGDEQTAIHCGRGEALPVAVIENSRSPRGARIVLHDDCYAHIAEQTMNLRIEHMHETAYRILENRARAAAEAEKSERYVNNEVCGKPKHNV